MLKKLIFTFMLLTIFSISVMPNTTRDLGPEPTLDLNKINKYILLYTNIQRIKARLFPLTYNSILEKAAIWQSKYCVYIKDLSHTANVNRMNEVDDRIKAYGGNCNVSGENLIVAFSTNIDGIAYFDEQDENGPYRDYRNHTVYWRNELQIAFEMVRSWMESPGHRSNILDRDFNSMGAGAAKGIYSDEKSYYGAQVFTGNVKHDFKKLKVIRKKNGNKIFYEIQFPKVLKVKILVYNKDKSIKLLNPKVTKKVNGIVHYVFHKPSSWKGNLYVSLIEKDPLIIYPMKRIRF